MSCINIYHPDYIKLLSEIDDSIIPFELPTLIRLYQKMNNTDKIPSVSEIYEIDNRTKSQEIPNQIQDIQGFKDFVQGNQFQKLTAEEKAKTIEQVTKEIYSNLGNKTKSGNVVIQSVYQIAGVQYAKSIGGVFSLRINGTNNQFGNPFSSVESEIQKGLIRTKSTRESVEKYIEWILSPTTTIKPEQHKFIREWLQSGKLKGKPIVYYKELGEPSHATALDYLINKYDWENTNKQYSKLTAEEKTKTIEELFESNPELASISTPEQYSQYLDTILPDSKVEEIDNSLYISVLNQLEQENIIEKDCTGGGKLKAEKGLQTNFTKGGKWKIYEIFEGKSHKQGGIDINIKNNQISFTNKNGSIKAKYGLVIPKDN